MSEKRDNEYNNLELWLVALVAFLSGFSSAVIVMYALQVTS